MSVRAPRRAASRRPRTPVDEAPQPEPTPASDPKTMRLGELLIASDTITPSALRAALEEQQATGAPLGTILMNIGAIDDQDLANALSEQKGIVLVNLASEAPDPDAVARLPEAVARAISAVPMRTGDQGLEVAVADPSPEVKQRIEAAVGAPVTLLIGPEGDVRQAIDRSYRSLEEVERQANLFIAAAPDARRSEGSAIAAAATADTPVVRIVDLLIAQALRDRASDIHIEPMPDSLRVRYRIDGALHEVMTLPESMAPALVSRIKVQAGMNIVERRRPQDGQLTMQVDGRAVDLRVSTLATIWGEKCVMRVLDKGKNLLRLGDLGMTATTHDLLQRMAHSPFGMLLCAGPTGSGKTTTLYATLAELAQADRNIVTIEDPVEYVFPGINQIQVNEQAGVTFADGLRAILRQDPDVILVGETRDVETARVASQSALTGHLVLSSVHATDSVAALHRFLDMGIESFLVASSVLGVVSQRLVRRICRHCKRRASVTPEEAAFLESCEADPKARLYEGSGCNLCSGTGYKDRIGVYEVLQVTPEIRRLVVGWATQDELRRQAQKQGMRTLREEGAALVEQGVTTVAEVMRSIYSL